MTETRVAPRADLVVGPDPLHGSFPSRADVARGAAHLEQQPTWSDPRPGGVVRRWTVRVGPGLVQLLTTVSGDDSEPGGTEHQDWCRVVRLDYHADSCPRLVSDRKRCSCCECGADRRGQRVTSCSGCPLRDPYAVWRPVAQRWERDAPPTRRILAWSPKSRANMTRTIVGLDWHQLLADQPSGWRPVMWTVTMPRDWQPLAPSGAVFKRQLQALYKRWHRRWGRRWAGVWKLEFQRRGAPHVHAYGPAPAGRIFREWLSVAWTEVVWNVDLGWTEGEPWHQLVARVEREHGRGVRDHLVAGTGVDWGEGARAIDPKRLGVYFAKRTASHNLGASKEYQHVVPAEWMGRGNGPGRWWGYRGMQRATVDVEVDGVQFVAMKRLLQRHTRAQRRTRQARGLVLNEDTGELRPGRARRRRYRIRALDGGGERSGAFVLHNDAPAWIAQAARWWALAAGDPPDPGRLGLPAPGALSGV